VEGTLAWLAHQPVRNPDARVDEACLRRRIRGNIAPVGTSA
jgi:hypothetical protein